jgi:hypothetical protein
MRSAREALHLHPRIESDEQRVVSAFDQAMRAAGTGAAAAMAEGRTISLEQARDETLAAVGVLRTTAQSSSGVT